MNFEDLLSKWFKGNADAVSFALQIWEAAQIWDDMKDGAKQGSDDVEDLLAWLAFGKEYSPFFAKYQPILRPALLGMYLKWSAANVLEVGDEDDINKAYMLRAGFYDVLHLMVWLVGGNDWARRVGPEIYRAYGETLNELKREFDNA